MHAYLWSYVNTHACAIGATEAPLDWRGDFVTDCSHFDCI